MQVLTQRFSDLSADEQEIASNNGAGKEYATYIRIVHDGTTRLLESDACEPEDATLRRDFSWVKDAIELAYELGRGAK